MANTDVVPASQSDRYAWKEPEAKLQASQHFSSLLLFGASSLNTTIEFAILLLMALAAVILPQKLLDTPGSMPFAEFAFFFWITSAIRRLYNAYLEAVWFSCPQHRTQPPREHALKQAKDLCGRERAQLDLLEGHDRWTLLSQVALELTFYFCIPGYFPKAQAEYGPWHQRLLSLVLNHYLLSFNMYWMHRALHTNKWMWDNIHSIHHWAKHPLSRNTYEDHWLDNFMNAIVGHGVAQMVIPLDHGMWWFSRVFRILESLEKHSGVSCYYNVAHSLQRWLPYAQMPHHHDFHHEGHKGCNFTFTSMGGVWDCVFGSRKVGRASKQVKGWATAADLKMMMTAKDAAMKTG